MPRRVDWDSAATRQRGEGFARPQVRVVTGGTARLFELPEQGVLTVGRGSATDIQIEDESVSREHARLHVGDGYAIEDLDSANGVKVRGTRIAAGTPTRLSPHDVVEVGDSLLVIHDEADAAAGPDDDSPLDLPDGVIVIEPAVKRVYRLAVRIADTPLSVLILGETGAGKEILAQTIHDASSRRDQKLLKLNCAALPEQLLESELFGHAAGAFTGATKDKVGLIESAAGGTVFLDEIGEMPLAVQAKVLRVIEEKMVLPVGRTEARPVDVRFIGATHRNLEEEIENRAFRRDLYYRLNGIALLLPPLRERPAELVPLAERFIAAFSAVAGRPPPRLTPEAVEALRAHPWPGNIRELRNVVERGVALTEGDAMSLDALAFGNPMSAPKTDTGGGRLAGEVKDLERDRIINALNDAGGNQTEAARALGISRSTLLRRLAEFDLPRPRKSKD